MTGNYPIAANDISGAIPSGWKKVFNEAFPNGTTYQTLLDYCAIKGHVNFGRWLINTMGATSDTREYNSPVNTAERIIIFAGNLKFQYDAFAVNIIAGGRIEAEEGIRVLENLMANGDITAVFGISAGQHIQGDTIKAQEGIRAGWDIDTRGNLTAGESIRAGGTINSEGSISSNRGIESGEHILANGVIWAKEDILAGKDIDSERSIIAVRSIVAGGDIAAKNSVISCRNIIAKGLIHAANRIEGKDVAALGEVHSDKNDIAFFKSPQNRRQGGCG